MFHRTQKIFPRSNERVLGSRGHTGAGTIAKSNKNHQVWSHEGSTFFKKGPHFGQNSRPGESDPYVKIIKFDDRKKCGISLLLFF